MTEDLYKGGHYAQAFPLLQKAVESGDDLAAAYLGEIYEYGMGVVPKDEVRAVSCYRRAANAGSALGMNDLGLMYEGGRGGLPKDERTAVTWYRKAADAPGTNNLDGNIRGSNNLA